MKHGGHGVRLVLAGGLAWLLAGCVDGAATKPEPTVAVPAPSAMSAPEPSVFRVAAIGVDLPARLASFERVGSMRYPDPRLGESVKYASPRILGADIYIYDAGRAEIGTGIESPVVRREYRDYKSVIEQTWPLRRGAGPLSAADERIFRDGPVPLLDARYRGQVNGEDVVTRFLLTGYRDQYVKLRISYPLAAERGEPRLVDDFVAALAALLVPLR